MVTEITPEIDVEIRRPIWRSIGPCFPIKNTVPASQLKIRTELAVHGSLLSYFKIRTNLAVHGSLHPFEKIRTKMAVYGSLHPFLKIRTRLSLSMFSSASGKSSSLDVPPAEPWLVGPRSKFEIFSPFISSSAQFQIRVWTESVRKLFFFSKKFRFSSDESL